MNAILAEYGMKVDGRTLDHNTLEQIRRMAFERVREGEKPSDVIASFGFCQTTIYKWMKAAAGRGLNALCSTRGTGRPRILTPAQERQVFLWINGRNPFQSGLEFGLWTRQIVSTLIEQQFGVRRGVTAVGALLAKLGLTPQKPLQRAYQRDPKLSSAGRASVFQSLPLRQGARARKYPSGMSRFFGPTRYTARPGGSRPDPGGAAPRSTPVDLGSLCGQCAGGLLVANIQGCAQRRVVCRTAQANDASSQKTPCI